MELATSIDRNFRHRPEVTSKPWKFVDGLTSDNHATKLFTGVRKLQTR